MDHICWTRAGSAAGETLEDIMGRKECERKALSGTFFWQVGNHPPVNEIRTLWKKRSSIQLIISKQKTKAQRKHESPDEAIVWRSYFNCCSGRMEPLPDGALVTSGGLNCPSYALVCKSKKSLKEQWEKEKKGDFDPCLLNKNIPAQRITALFEKDSQYLDNPKKPKWMCGYKEDIKGMLSQEYGYWICLQDPKALDIGEWELRKEEIKELEGNYQHEKWLKLVRDIRSD